MNDDSSSKVPWNEAQWERFLQQADARTARYGEILETVQDDPNRDAIVAREMGWARPPDDFADATSADREWAGDDPEETFVHMSDLTGMVDHTLAEARRELAEMDAQLQELPAHRESMAWGLRAAETLKQLPDDPAVADDMIAAFSCCLVAPRIAGGHGMGYEDEVLCGNIVSCSRGLRAAEESLEAMVQLSRIYPAFESPLGELIEAGQQVRRLIAEHIERLRSRVWWD